MKWRSKFHLKMPLIALSVNSGLHISVRMSDHMVTDFHAKYSLAQIFRTFYAFTWREAQEVFTSHLIRFQFETLKSIQTHFSSTKPHDTRNDCGCGCHTKYSRKKTQTNWLQIFLGEHAYEEPPPTKIDWKTIKDCQYTVRRIVLETHMLQLPRHCDSFGES